MQIPSLYRRVHDIVSADPAIDPEGKDNLFYTRLESNTAIIYNFYEEVYGQHPAAINCFDQLIRIIIKAHLERPVHLKDRDSNKERKDHWFLSNKITGMSLYVDRFCGNLQTLEKKLDYFKKLGVNFLHLMPLFEGNQTEYPGSNAGSSLRKIDPRFGTLQDLKILQQRMQTENMFLMLDLELNQTSFLHESARDQHYTDPDVFVEMLDIIFFYANLGVDMLRIDEPFIWKGPDTNSQNLPMMHTVVQLIKQCAQVASPGMAILTGAIAAPKEIMNYFGEGIYKARECDFAYNSTQMALQWDALATGDTRILLAAQNQMLQKPFGTSWITYTRSHDDIFFGYDDDIIQQSGFDPVAHRDFLKNYYSGTFPGSTATGASFSFNPGPNDLRICGSLASLCGLEKAIQSGDEQSIETAIRKIMLMQAQSFFIGGVPLIFYGDEAGYTNDYSYQDEPGKAYDNRWMHRPAIDWQRNQNIDIKGTVEEKIFSGTKKLIRLRSNFEMVADYKNIKWLTSNNIHVAGFLRTLDDKKLYCLFNFSAAETFVTWYIFKEHGPSREKFLEHWEGRSYLTGEDWEHLVIPPYGFLLLEVES